MLLSLSVTTQLMAYQHTAFVTSCIFWKIYIPENKCDLTENIIFLVWCISAKITSAFIIHVKYSLWFDRYIYIYIYIYVCMNESVGEMIQLLTIFFKKLFSILIFYFLKGSSPFSYKWDFFYIIRFKKVKTNTD